MRDRETIDSELRRIASARRSIREQGGQPGWGQLDDLLDERLGHRVEAVEPEASKAWETDVVADTLRDRVKTNSIRPHRRKSVLRRFGPLAALPLSVLAVAIALVAMLAVHRQDPQTAQPPEVPPSSARPSTAAAAPAVPAAPTSPVNIADTAFIAALKHDGVPVPSQEYVTSQGHAVCDFLGHQSNFTEAVHYVQRSSIWDATQSTAVAAGAVVSYCPQYEAANSDEMRQTYQNALSDLQRIQGDLQGIRDDLQGIPGR